MPYATPTQLLLRYGAEEIAQRVDRGIPRMVTAELLTAAAAGESMAAQPQEVQFRVARAVLVLERALSDADDTINGYVSARYRLPLSVVPSWMERVACEMARYFLYDDQVTDTIKERYTACIATLRDVSTGKAQLGADSTSGDQPTSSAGAELVTGDRVWRRESSRGFL